MAPLLYSILYLFSGGAACIAALLLTYSRAKRNLPE
jgi:hypothetical protein